MSPLQSLEKSLDDIFVKQAPPLSASAKKALVQYLPWINLVLGLLAIYTVYVVWHWAHLASSLINSTNTLGATYGGSALAANHMGLGIWLGLAVLAVEAVLYIAAFPGTRDRKKSGWNLMFYALLVNIVYGVVIVFTSYGNIGSLLGTIIGSAVGLYLLFQIRSSYSKTGIPAKKAR